MAPVAWAGFNNQDMAGIAFDYITFQPIVPSGTMENGTISWDFELRLSPVDGRTYTLASVLGLVASIADVEDIDPFTDPTPFGSYAEADFDSTAALTQIVLPAGVSVASAAILPPCGRYGSPLPVRAAAGCNVSVSPAFQAPR